MQGHERLLLTRVSGPTFDMVWREDSRASAMPSCNANTHARSVYVYVFMYMCVPFYFYIFGHPPTYMQGHETLLTCMGRSIFGLAAWYSNLGASVPAFCKRIDTHNICMYVCNFYVRIHVCLDYMFNCPSTCARVWKVIDQWEKPDLRIGLPWRLSGLCNAILQRKHRRVRTHSIWCEFLFLYVWTSADTCKGIKAYWHVWKARPLYWPSGMMTLRVWPRHPVTGKKVSVWSFGGIWSKAQRFTSL